MIFGFTLSRSGKRGKSSMGWFFGFKPHLAVNDQGELLACCLTPGNVDDRKPVALMVKKLRGKLEWRIAAPFPLPLRNCSLNKDFISSQGCVKT